MRSGTSAGTPIASWSRKTIHPSPFLPVELAVPPAPGVVAFPGSRTTWAGEIWPSTRVMRWVACSSFCFRTAAFAVPSLFISSTARLSRLGPCASPAPSRLGSSSSLATPRGLWIDDWCRSETDIPAWPAARQPCLALQTLPAQHQPRPPNARLMCVPGAPHVAYAHHPRIPALPSAGFPIFPCNLAFLNFSQRPGPLAFAFSGSSRRSSSPAQHPLTPYPGGPTLLTESVRPVNHPHKDRLLTAAIDGAHRVRQRRRRVCGGEDRLQAW
ncbi:hypothetical protein B0J12DRAFT_372904 [Macrophomina phaseolina]|uniref:Uncharacterized protein n=1 Tax=Macrophomina phaseolina TaxID=35725 RepID=A0ABQ8GMP2_9PEZI|nr:hypothetical protein B0J12DRAFT_372904 [Macrophomina phaseolina]